MCEETQNYFWAINDSLGHGATSQVYKAYNKATGELVAAKVYQVAAPSVSGRSPNVAREKDFRPILEREMDILKGAQHENIVRYIALERVISSDVPRTPNSNTVREGLLLEYCNGGSLHNVLESPENRFGVKEDEFMLIFLHLTNALKYLHEKHTIHRDIKPDNIMLAININGERTYKLADLGVARLMNNGEEAFTSLVGTEEYIHPELYREAVRDNHDVLRNPLPARVEFPFEVDLWSLAVTLYQCATGELPFQPFAGTRKDRAVMGKILSTKPSGYISGMENTRGGNIVWSKTLPESCRLSPMLKKLLEELLQRLLESDRRKLMRFQEFFRETDRVLKTIPIHYLNLKKFKLTCSYFEPDESISKLFDELRKENEDDRSVEYNCLFQNVPYPIHGSMTVKTFCDQLPIPASHETPLVFYTFTPLPDNSPYVPVFFIPDVKPIKQANDVASACEWSKDVVGQLFYIKDQVVGYQHILQTAQCSTTIMQQQLRAKLIEFLCMIRDKLMVFRAIDELKSMLEQIDSRERSGSGGAIGSSSATTTSVHANSNFGRAPSMGDSSVPIGFSRLLQNDPSPCSTADNSLSPSNPRRPSSASHPVHILHESIRIFLRNYVKPFNQLIECEKDVLSMIEKEFGGQGCSAIDDQQPFLNSLWLSHRTNAYSKWVMIVDKFLKDLNDLNESFKKDRLMNTYNRLQIDSHYRRRKNLDELQASYIRFANEECYPNLVQIFQDYNMWIKNQSQLVQEFERLRQSYDKHCEEIMSYVVTIDDVRQMVHNNLRGWGNNKNGGGGTGSFPPPRESPLHHHYHQQGATSTAITATNSSENLASATALSSTPPIHSSEEDDGGMNQDSTGGNVSGSSRSHHHNKFLKKVQETTQRTRQVAEESVEKLGGILKTMSSKMSDR